MNTQKQIFTYLQSLEEETREFVLACMEADQNGTARPKPLDGGGCSPANCHDHVGCPAVGLANYYCACNGNVCVAVPET